MPIKIRAQKNVAGRSRDSTSTLTNDHLSEGFLLDPRKALQNEEVAQCFEHYLKSLSPWYDLTDCDSTFAAPVGTEAQHSPLLLSAIVAFAAIHRARTGHSAFMPLADAYHAQCLRLLIGLHDYDTATKDGTALAATCLLRSYEILGGLSRASITTRANVQQKKRIPIGTSLAPSLSSRHYHRSFQVNACSGPVFGTTSVKTSRFLWLTHVR